MIVMAFDLSSVCIGVCTVRINDETMEIEKMMSCPIIPPKFSPEILGYAKSKKKLPTTKSGELINTYYIPGETVITKALKQKRDKEVRMKKDIWVLEEIGKTMGNMISKITPDKIIVEKNAIFNGILTSILLAKVMGTLLGIAGMLGIPVKEYSVTQARSAFDIPEVIRNFTKDKTPDELKRIPDITKRALRELMDKEYGQYGLNMQTDDESDAVVVFNFDYKFYFKSSF